VEVGTGLSGDSVEASEVNTKSKESHFFQIKKNVAPWEEQRDE